MSNKQTHGEMEQKMSKLAYAGMKQCLAEISPKESQDTYRDLVETVNDVIWEVDVDMHYTYLSPKILEMFGYGSEELIGKKFTHLMPPDETERLINIFRGFAADPAPFTAIEATVIHKDGHPVFLENNGNPFFNSSGNLCGFRGVIRDITDRKKAHEELLRIRKAIDSTSDAIAIADPQGNHFFHNKAFYSMFGHTVEGLLAAGGPPAISANLDTVKDALKESEAKYRSILDAMTYSVYISSQDFRIEYMNPAMINKIGRDATDNACHRVIYDNDNPCPWCILDKVRQGKHVEYEVENAKKNRNYSVSNSPIFNSDGTISKLTIFRDITHIKAMEKQLSLSKKMESIGTLAGGIAHNFNNMLGIILGNSELIKKTIPENIQTQNNIDEIRTACLRAKDMVKQILAFSGQTNAELKPLRICPSIMESLNLIRPIIPATIEIRRDIPTELWSIQADPAQLNQIILHLCTNAAHSMKDKGGVLEVSLKKRTLDNRTKKNYHGLGPGDYVELNVRDTGCGIDKKIIDQIFDPFFTTKEIGVGSGMGLSIIHGIVKEHSGDIVVHSEPDKGTSFHILFPVIENEKTPEKISEEPPLSNGEKILFIDDELSLVFASKRNLESLGYEVVTERNPINALNVFKENPNAFDLIITDISMPDMTGIRLSEEIMKIRPNIPIILCSGFSERVSEQQAKALGIKYFLLKPYRLSEMAKKIRLALDAKQKKILKEIKDLLS